MKTEWSDETNQPEKNLQVFKMHFFDRNIIIR